MNILDEKEINALCQTLIKEWMEKEKPGYYAECNSTDGYRWAAQLEAWISSHYPDKYQLILDFDNEHIDDLGDSIVFNLMQYDNISK